MDKIISFEEAATIRPDGGHYILHASVVPDNMVLPNGYMYMKNWCGSMCHSNDRQMMWQVDSPWYDRPSVKERNFSNECEKVITFYNNEIQCKLLAIGDRIKEKYRTDFEMLKKPYADAVLESVPAHLRTVETYELQFVFHSDGWFLLQLYHGAPEERQTEGAYRRPEKIPDHADCQRINKWAACDFAGGLKKLYLSSNQKRIITTIWVNVQKHSGKQGEI